jgi:hypothetical protein
VEQKIDFIEELLLQSEQADQERKIELDRLGRIRSLRPLRSLKKGWQR